MAKNKRRIPKYDVFFVEIPKTDYLQDIEIQDEYEQDDARPRGLNEDQLSEIARDSLEVAKRNHSSQPPHSQSDKED
ncbi:MAG TPA: hypothetical protein VGH44_03515 [Candidatus Saccharimonadia bacterium]|jgi:hypothetical protein